MYSVSIWKCHCYPQNGPSKVKQKHLLNVYSAHIWAHIRGWKATALLEIRWEGNKTSQQFGIENKESQNRFISTPQPLQNNPLENSFFVNKPIYFVSLYPYNNSRVLSSLSYLLCILRVLLQGCSHNALLWGGVSLCSPGLKLLMFCLFLPVLGLQAWATMPGTSMCFEVPLSSALWSVHQKFLYTGLLPRYRS